MAELSALADTMDTSGTHNIRGSSARHDISVLHRSRINESCLTPNTVTSNKSKYQMNTSLTRDILCRTITATAVQIEECPLVNGRGEQ
jgi:hypothetical protein